jgi:hypothetical protein
MAANIQLAQDMGGVIIIFVPGMRELVEVRE